jgi:flagellar biosynthesis/type III secretory pathway M-ring protein FliF/YscJ
MKSILSVLLDTSDEQFKEWFQIAGGIAAIALLAWIVIYNLGKPWNCQQAREMAESAREDEKKEWQRAEQGKFSSDAVMLTMTRDTAEKVRNAESRISDKCSP